MIAKLRTTLVERRLGEAIEELELDALRAETLILESKFSDKVGEMDTAAPHLEGLEDLKHRLSTIATIADSLVGHERLSAGAHALDELSGLRERLQWVADRIARY